MKEFDVVVWGATGFTGRLVAEFLLQRHGVGREVRWALGGRSRAKLESLRSELARSGPSQASDLPLVVGDAQDEAFLAALAERTAVVCSTVGPYAIYGSKLVAACAAGGTHYCDLTGEVHWMRRMIDLHEKQAVESGARIVHTCGFDSVPSDLGVFLLQREMKARHGVASAHVRYRVEDFAGGASGGTIASMINMLEEAEHDPSIRRLLADPYALNPQGENAGPDGPEVMRPFWDPVFGSWTAPFVMAGINTRVVRRSNALLDWAYGRDFRYDEAVLSGSGPLGVARATGAAVGTLGVMAVGAVGPLRRALSRFLPEPGEGPSRERREAGFYHIALHAEHPDDPAKSLRGRIEGDRDPGYGSTAKILAECAVCLAQDPLTVGGGFWTPASAMGDPLLARLDAHAGVRFSLLDAD